MKPVLSHPVWRRVFLLNVRLQPMTETLIFCLIVLIILSNKGYVRGGANDDYNVAVYRQPYYQVTCGEWRWKLGPTAPSETSLCHCSATDVNGGGEV